jgi:hypothetical protein
MNSSSIKMIDDTLIMSENNKAFKESKGKQNVKTNQHKRRNLLNKPIDRAWNSSI